MLLVSKSKDLLLAARTFFSLLATKTKWYFLEGSKTNFVNYELHFAKSTSKEEGYVPGSGSMSWRQALGLLSAFKVLDASGPSRASFMAMMAA